MVNTISVNSQPLDLAKKYVNTDAPVDLFRKIKKTLPKALRTQALTTLTSNFGLVGLVQYAW